MKKLTFLTTLILTVMFSSTSFGEWTNVGKNVKGTTYYVDFERIRKHDGYVYWWDLGDYLKPDKWGTLSGKVYNQGDCKLFRFKALNYSHHKEPMGKGIGDSKSPKNPEWKYPHPNSSSEIILKRICRYAK